MLIFVILGFCILIFHFYRTNYVHTHKDEEYFFHHTSENRNCWKITVFFILNISYLNSSELSLPTHSFHHILGYRRLF